MYVVKGPIQVLTTASNKVEVPSKYWALVKNNLQGTPCLVCTQLFDSEEAALERLEKMKRERSDPQPSGRYAAYQKVAMDWLGE